MTMDQVFEAYASVRFMVVVDQINYAAFTECRLPSLDVEMSDIREGGQNTYTHRLPTRVNTGTVTLRHGIMRGDALIKWYFQVLTGDIASATRQVTVEMYDPMGTVVMSWNFRNAYPIKWSGPTLKSGESQILIQELEFVHHGFSVET